MTKLLATCAALSVAGLLALSDPASAASARPDGLKNFEQIEVSDARRRRVRRYYRRHYHVRPYYYRPYYRPYYYRPYYAPVPFPFWPFFWPYW